MEDSTTYQYIVEQGALKGDERHRYSIWGLAGSVHQPRRCKTSIQEMEDLRDSSGWSCVRINERLPGTMFWRHS